MAIQHGGDDVSCKLSIILLSLCTRWHVYLLVPLVWHKEFYVIFQKRVRGLYQVSKREKHLKPRGRWPSGFIIFERLETWWNPEHEFLKLLLQQRK